MKLAIAGILTLLLTVSCQNKEASRETGGPGAGESMNSGSAGGTGGSSTSGSGAAGTP